MGDADSELAASYKAGHAPAFEALYWRHAERVWRFARYFSGSDEIAAEIVQETFLRLARSLHGFEGRSRFTTWLHMVVRSVAIDVTAKHRKAPKAAEDEQIARLPAEDSEPMDGAISKETREAVREAVSRLPENEREAVILCELQELPLKDACEALGWSESRMKVTLYRARRRLKTMLSSYVGTTS
ncbi:MAG: RNA polymerase sigma factor [Planctomycetota bacterium]|nr:RNA polymerase sigma factor [Planctomycetota bacterium]